MYAKATSTDHSIYASMSEIIVSAECRHQAQQRRKFQQKRIKSDKAYMSAVILDLFVFTGGNIKLPRPLTVFRIRTVRATHFEAFRALLRAVSIKKKL